METCPIRNRVKLIILSMANNPTSKAERHLAKIDPLLGKVIKEAGPCALRPEARISPYQSLLRSIVYQQLHGKAAETILKRFIASFPEGKFPEPSTVLRKRIDSMRKCGLSEAKALAIKDLALKTVEGTVPSSREIKHLSDEEIIGRLTQIRGIGVWTVQMMLMFKLGRLDVLPTTDFGVQKGFSLLYRKPMPKPKNLEKYGEIWKPYRSVAAWYLWRAVDLAKQK